MEDVVMQEWNHTFDGQDLHEFVNCSGLIDEGLFDFDLLHDDWTSWSDVLFEDQNGSHNSSFTSNLPSIEEDLMIVERLHESEDSVIQLEHEINSPQRLNPYEEPICHHSSSGNISVESSQTIDGSAIMDALIPSSTDSAECKGLRLVHLLTACAEEISYGHHELTDIILGRLRELSSPTGSTMERVAYYLCHSLQQRHDRSLGDQMKGQFPNINEGYNSSKDNFLGALSLLNQVYPYIRMAHFTANQSILEAIPASTQNVHIIDFDIMEGMQWPPLMEALKSENYKIGHLKITAVKWEREESAPFSSCCGDTGRRLSEYANSLGIPLSFQEKEMEDVERNLPSSEDEIIIANCMWELPHMLERSKRDLLDFFHGVRGLNPVVLTVGTGPRGLESDEKLNFKESFTQCLMNMCSVFDSSDAGLPTHYGLAQAMVERLFLGPMMCKSINSMSSEEGKESMRVIDIPLNCDFAEHKISQRNIMYAEYMLANKEVGKQYKIESLGNHQLLLKWNSTALTCVSTWSIKQ